MNLVMNILVLVFEILYYSMFMYYAKGEGKFKRYLLLFSLITIIGLFIGTNYLYSFILLVIMILFGMKYVIKLKTSLYDMFFIYIMLFTKMIIELVISYILYFIILKNIFVITIAFLLLKLILVIIVKNKIMFLYSYLKNKWNNNNFYIRYLFAIMNFIYIIIIAIYIIYILI